MSGSRRRAVALAVVALLALGAAGCGSASSTTASKTTTSTAAKQPSAAPATANAVPAGAVAVVAGTTITQAAFNHWMSVAAKSQTAQTPGAPVIVPDPPDYTGCVATVRKHIPSLRNKPAKTLTADCRQLFQSLSSQVMGFLIKANWIQADGARRGIALTDAQVAATYAKDKQQQFPGGKGYQAFLAKTGQTDQDVRFRVRVNLIFGRLTAREKGSTNAKQTAVDKREKQLFSGQTRCAPLVLMADCGNYGAG